MFKKYILRAARPLGIFLIFAFSVACIFASLLLRDIDDSGFFGKLIHYTVSFDNRFYDARMKDVIDPNFKSKEQVLVEIDNYSLDVIGVFPFPRTVYANFINKAKNFGAKVIAMDVLFPEESLSCGGESPDDVLSRAFTDFSKQENRSIFFGYTVSGVSKGAMKEFPDTLYSFMPNSQSSSESGFEQLYIEKFNFPISTFADSGAGLGYITVFQDPDGIFRNYLIAANVDNIYIGSLALNAFDAYVKSENRSMLKIQKDGEGSVYVGDDSMETNSRGETKVRWIGSKDQFPSISLIDFLKADDNDPKIRSLIEDKIVFLGSTGTGAHDLRPSPVDGAMPGVFMHMNTIHMLLHKYFYKPADQSVQYSLILLIIGSIMFWAASRLGYASIDLITLFILIAASFYLDRVYFMPEGYELKLFYCYFCFIASYSWNTFLNFSEANKEKKQVRGTFARYVAPTIVDEMLKDPEKLVVGGFRRDITCLFSDVRDFTSISEGLSPVELAQSLNMYMGKMTDIVFETRGTLDKYIGDAIVAFWGAPLEIGNHAQYAIEAALKMMDTLPAINEEFRRLGRPEFLVGIGLNSGECNVGNMGSSRIFSYTALGDNMNLGARLESLCKHYGTQILISEYTLKRLDTKNIKYRTIDNVIVKGKTTPVLVYEVIHSHHFMALSDEAYQAYLAAHAAFLQRNFQEAAAMFGKVLTFNENDKSSKRFKAICENFAAHPDLAGENFSVTVMTEK